MYGSGWSSIKNAHENISQLENLRTPKSPIIVQCRFVTATWRRERASNFMDERGEDRTSRVLIQQQDGGGRGVEDMGGMGVLGFPVAMLE